MVAGAIMHVDAGVSTLPIAPSAPYIG